MNRNQNNHFSNVPQVDIARSRFEMSQRIKTTFNTGKLIPFYVREVLPGDTFSVETPLVCRMTTPIFPVMDDAYLDYYYFFVPNRLVWDHWKEFMGENNSVDQPWVSSIQYSVPTLSVRNLGAAQHSVADYFGIPTKVANFSISALPFRGYVKIWNDWFRDQNNMTAAMNSTSDENDILHSTQNAMGYLEDDDTLHTAYLGGACLPVSKFHDYFTSALPSPQKGEAVPLLNSDYLDILPDGYFNLAVSGNSDSVSVGDDIVFTDKNPIFDNGTIIGWSGNAGVTTTSDFSLPLEYNSGLSLSPELIGNLANINSLRYAFQVQRFLERDARGGTRYIEMIKSHFGVSSPDGRLQRSEYLGGKRLRINVSQVVQTSSTDSTSPQGNTAAYSLTVSDSNDFTKSFTEHGFVIGVLCVRTNHTYQQGVEKFWFRKDKFDYYWPVFAHIGEQPIYNKEIYLSQDYIGADAANNGIFGYQEAWADYRYSPDRVCGAFRSNWYGGSLDSWTYSDYYTSLPTLGKEFISETDVNVQRTLAVHDEPQFFADIKVVNVAVRPMPVYSVPGLIDHM